MRRIKVAETKALALDDNPAKPRHLGEINVTDQINRIFRVSFYLEARISFSQVSLRLAEAQARTRKFGKPGYTFSPTSFHENNGERFIRTRKLLPVRCASGVCAIKGDLRKAYEGSTS